GRRAGAAGGRGARGRGGRGAGCPAPPQRCGGRRPPDAADVPAAVRRARFNIESLGRAIDAGYEIVVPGPTCSRMLKQEYPLLVPGAAAERVAAHVFDLGEYLTGLHVAGQLDQRFGAGLGRVAYHAPCHLRVQEIGFKARDLLRLVPDTSVEVLERCTGMDGTWGFKQEFFDESLRVPRPLVRELVEIAPSLIVSA